MLKHPIPRSGSPTCYSLNKHAAANRRYSTATEAPAGSGKLFAVAADDGSLRRLESAGDEAVFTEWWMAALPGWATGAAIVGARDGARGRSVEAERGFDALARAYLSQSDLLRGTLAAARLMRVPSPVGFVLGQAIDALSPAKRCSQSEALQTAVESRELAQACALRRDFAKAEFR